MNQQLNTTNITGSMLLSTYEKFVIVWSPVRSSAAPVLTCNPVSQVTLKKTVRMKTCNVIELRSRKVLTPLAPKANKIVDEVVVEEVETGGEVEKNSDEGVVEKENDQGVVENEKKKKIEGEKSEKLINEDSILRKSKSQILKDGDKPQVIPSYVM